MIVFVPGQRFISQLEPDLGLGIVTEIQGRTVKFNLPAVNQCRMYRTRWSLFAKRVD